MGTSSAKIASLVQSPMSFPTASTIQTLSSNRSCSLSESDSSDIIGGGGGVDSQYIWNDSVKHDGFCTAEASSTPESYSAKWSSFFSTDLRGCSVSFGCCFLFCTFFTFRGRRLYFRALSLIFDSRWSKIKRNIRSLGMKLIALKTLSIWFYCAVGTFCSSEITSGSINPHNLH